MLGSLEWDEYSGEAEILNPALSQFGNRASERAPARVLTCV
jgi:hypothetical protein